MSTELLTLLTVVEIVALVAALALFLIAIASRLRSIDEGLGVLGSDLEQIDRHVGAIAPTTAELNQPLNDIVGALPQIAVEAEDLAAGVRKA